MVAAATESQKLLQDQIFQLLEITHNGQVWRFTNGNNDPLDVIAYGGETYNARQFKIGRFKVTSRGSLPRVDLSIDNVDRFWWSIVADNDDLINADVVFREVYRQHLDDGANPSGTEIVDRVDYVVLHMTRINQSKITFRLGSPLDVEEALVGRIMSRNVCSRTYRVPTATTDDFIDVDTADSGVDCPYTGSSYFDRTNMIVTDWQEDQCPLSLDACTLRFGEGTELPFGGFPGIGDPDA